MNLTPSSTNSLSGYSSFISEHLHALSLRLGELLAQIKADDNIWAILTLMAISFAYGFVHASGPGHGKTLVASYFSSNDKSYKKAFVIALLIAVVHTFSALFITLFCYFVLNSIFTLAISNATGLITKISAIAIISMGVYFLYNKIKHYRSLKKTKWSATPIHDCPCASCKSRDASELTLILSAGIIPCPGTITIFLFSITLGLYFVGFLSAVAMSIGMGSVIAFTAIVSTKMRKTAKNRFSKFLIFLDFGAVFAIILLGIVLLLI
jgi:ABC-type nickel/cobalt efflux system permease component RcnA